MIVVNLGTFEAVEADWARFAALGRPPRIALVGCGAAKEDQPAPARALYTGDLFRKSLAYAELVADRTLILSGRWGLVELDYVLEPYEYKLRSQDAKHWAHAVVDCHKGLGSRFCSGWGPPHPGGGKTTMEIPGELIILAGQDYAAPLMACLRRHPRITTSQPMEGLQIGERLRWLKQETDTLRRGHQAA